MAVPMAIVPGRQPPPRSSILNRRSDSEGGRRRNEICPYPLFFACPYPLFFAEKRVTAWAKTRLNDVTEQVSIRPRLNNGKLADYSVRMDTMGRNRTTGAIELIDAKSSARAPLQPNQIPGYPLIARNGGVVTGENGLVAFPAGTQIPPTKVQLVRPSDLPTNF